VKIKEQECDCSHPEIKKNHPNGCSINQVIKYHGDQSLSELFKHIELLDKDE